jgi:hypothetical protein
MKKANMARTLVWSLCFGVAITASAAAAGLGTEPTNPAVRLAVDGQPDPTADSLYGPGYGSSDDLAGFETAANFRAPSLSIAPEARPDPYQYDTTGAQYADTHGIGPQTRNFNLEYTLSAPARATGLNLDVAVAPRAGFSIGPEGGEVRSLGGEVRLGKRLETMVRSFDSQGATWDRPSWYFFAATDGSALTWTPEAMAGAARRGVRLQEERVVVGDAQIGVSMEARGMQASFGFTNREITNGKETIDENFVGASLTMRR